MLGYLTIKNREIIRTPVSFLCAIIISLYLSHQKGFVMPLLEISQETRPSPDTLRQWLQEQSQQYDPVEELLRLQRELGEFEQRHQLGSDTFFQLYEAGEMGDDLDFVRWVGRYRLYRNLKQAISDSLKLVVVSSFPLPA
ncbi:MAG: hypothetical protein GY796_06250 [Chloroflexi bacterium]|nr:hypothetical protein [Chloroflexota bacterium]